jgi:hypothetical protein
MDINWRVKSSNAPKRGGGGGKPLICNCQCVRRTYRIRSKTSADQIEKRECDDRRKKNLAQDRSQVYLGYVCSLSLPSYSPLVAGTHKQKRREKTKMKKNKKGK